MTSEARVLTLAFAVLGCTGTAHDATVAGAPLVVVHGHVDLAALDRGHPEAALFGALVWAAVPAVSPLCLEFPRPELAPACPDPYGVFWGQLERAAPIGDDGSFALELYNLPKASVSVGDEVTRIAFGSLIVIEDVNGDGQPTLPVPILSQGGRDQGPEDPGGIPEDSDTVVAASFHSLHAEQTRVVFREGGFVTPSGFYPAPGCAAPPSGFSVMTAPPYAEDRAAPGGCATLPIDAPIEVTPLPRDEALAFLCRPVQRGSRVRQPEADREPIPTFQKVCLSHEILGVVAPPPCARLTTYALKGCDTDPLCPEPEWDQTPGPPHWWPCP
jgi:hypothetical protein